MKAVAKDVNLEQHGHAAGQALTGASIPSSTLEA